jgi:hypothetical protein
VRPATTGRFRLVVLVLRERHLRLCWERECRVGVRVGHCRLHNLLLHHNCLLLSFELGRGSFEHLALDLLIDVRTIKAFVFGIKRDVGDSAEHVMRVLLGEVGGKWFVLPVARIVHQSAAGEHQL